MGARALSRSGSFTSPARDDTAMWKRARLVPSWQSLNRLACIVSGAVYLMLLGLVAWWILENLNVL